MLVNGGSRGIGRGIARELAGEGADVVITYLHSLDAAQSVVSDIKSIGRRAAAIQADSCNSRDVFRAVSEASSFLGSIDILVNNAGVNRQGSFLDISEEDWDYVMVTNTKGYFLYGQAVARQMTERGKGGSIVNITSRAGIRSTPDNPAHYSCSKAAVEMLTRKMAGELAKYGIRVNSVAPGTVETDMTRERLSRPDYREGIVSLIPLKRVGTPVDVASAVAWLVSSEASMVTGLSLVVDGGCSVV